MAKVMGRRSARILALILALIMLGSVFAYVMRGGQIESRHVKLRLSDFREYVNLTPKGAYEFEYVNLTEFAKLDPTDDLRIYVNGKLRNIVTPIIFSRNILEIPGGLREIYSAKYAPAISLYFVNCGQSKVYFARESEFNYKTFKIQVRRGIGLIDEISPLIVGYTPLVNSSIDTIDNRSMSCSNVYGYLKRINGSFAYAYFIFGDVAKRRLTSENKSVSDFFFEGYRYNYQNDSYEKLWALHFLDNFFFGKMNESIRGFGYYKFENYEDGFGVAIMGDKNFSRIINAKPRILTLKIIVNETK